MKKLIISGLIFTLSSQFFGNQSLSYTEDQDNPMGQMTHYKHSINDERISLNLSPEMKQHQLTNMRSHLDAVQSIIGLISEGEFEKASQIAYSKLGLTEEMKNMCNKFNNEKFKNLGLAFHKSGDDLRDALQTKDIKNSLRALQTTMGYCAQCHATFRQ